VLTPRITLVRTRRRRPAMGGKECRPEDTARNPFDDNDIKERVESGSALTAWRAAAGSRL
jgi:hypothetical protein